MEKNKRNKIIGLSIGILIVLIIVVSSTYAYWQITKTQKTPNDIVAACLNLDLNDASTENTGINLDSAWPISDEEGKTLTGYSFTVTNNCNEEINYIVGLNRVEEENYLQDSSIKLQLDDNSAFLYSELSDVEYVDPDNTEYTAISSKQVSVETISANGTNTHIIRVWIDEDAPVTEQSKTFLGQVFITGGQGIEVSECFTIADNGTILGYDESCGLEVKVPAEINGIPVKTITDASFNYGELIAMELTNKQTGEFAYVIFNKNIKNEELFLDYMVQENCEDSSCTIEDLEAMGMIYLNTLEEYNSFDWENYTIDSSYNCCGEDENGINFGDCVGDRHITSLDLSDAVYLETIGNSSFVNDGTNDEPINDTCELVEDPKGNYYQCLGSLKEVIFPQNGVLKSIGDYAFKENQLTEITIPYSLEETGYESFSDNQISTLIINDSSENPSVLSTIGNASFRNNKLNKLIIPASVSSIETSAFSGNLNLSEIIIKRTEEDAIANVTFGSYWNGSATITYDPNYTE